MDLPFLLIWMYPEVKVLPKYENKASLLYSKVKFINFNLYYYTLFFETSIFFNIVYGAGSSGSLLNLVRLLNLAQSYHHNK